MSRREAGVKAHRVETVLTEDRTLTLKDLPFHAGEAVEVIIRPRLEPSSEQKQKTYPLHGKPLRYDRPTDPVAEDEWDAVR